MPRVASSPTGHYSISPHRWGGLRSRKPLSASPAGMIFTATATQVPVRLPAMAGTATSSDCMPWMCPRLVCHVGPCKEEITAEFSQALLPAGWLRDVLHGLMGAARMPHRLRLRARHQPKTTAGGDEEEGRAEVHTADADAGAIQRHKDERQQQNSYRRLHHVGDGRRGMLEVGLPINQVGEGQSCIWPEPCHRSAWASNSHTLAPREGRARSAQFAEQCLEVAVP